MLPLSILFLYPFYYILINTFKTAQEGAYNPLGLPKHIIFDSYARVFRESPVLNCFFNTFILASVSVTVILVIGVMAAYPIAYNPNKLNNAAMLYLMMTFLVPFQAILLSLFEIMKSLHLINELYGMVLYYSNGSALTVFLAVGYMRTIPKELNEAAIVDGCSVFGIFWRIIFPLLKPISITSIIFNTMWVWNDFVAPNLFLNSRSKGTMVLEIFRAQGQFQVDWPSFMALSVLTLAPLVIFYIIMQKHIIKGLTAGAVKG